VAAPTDEAGPRPQGGAPAGPDRRRQPRYVVDIPIRVRCAQGVFPAHLRDICRDAAWVESDRGFPIDARLSIALELPGTGGPMEIDGRVIRVAPGEKAPNGMAILFGDLPPAAATRIDFYIALQG
jgi:hypothetical protein